MSSRRRLSVLLLLPVIAGCGSGAQEQPRSTPTAAASTATAAPEQASAAGIDPCRDSVSQLIGGNVTTGVKDASPGMATCVYKSGRTRVEVQVDTNPQVPFRFERAVVERGQNAVWGHNQHKLPRQIHGIGVGADWFPADRDLLFTDNHRLIDVVLVKNGTLKLSRAIAKAMLQP